LSKIAKKDKQFCEEIITYFPVIKQGPHRKWRLQQFFVAAGTALPSSYLATVGEYTYSQTHSSNISYVVACILCRGNVFIEPLCSNDRRDAQTYRLMGGIYELRRWDVLRCHKYIPSFINIDSVTQKLIVGVYTITQTPWWSHKPTFVFPK
jgi:hypothetical protein